MTGSPLPLGDLLRQLVLALGAALALANIAVLLRERRRTPEDPRPRPNKRTVFVNIVIGLVLSLWGLASIVLAR
ncbi:MAG TPA: hypothetical protein VNE62_01105 [Actinomycetota bacterium]|nr:hypothetical protein [Actinomycetota bacterium]